MGVINVFRLLPEKSDELRNTIIKCSDFQIEQGFRGHNYCLSLFVYNEPDEKPIGWSWLLDAFGAEMIHVVKQSWAILIIESELHQYALTFGNAFYYVDKFCDRDFAFEVARKFRYKKVKTTAQSSPNTNKNKTITSHIDNNFFEYESGESFVKIKGNIELAHGFTLFKSGIEIGTSIKFTIEDMSVYNCIRVIDHIEAALRHPDLTKIPVFYRVKEPELLDTLNEELEEAVASDNLTLNFSDFDIVGTTEVFRAESTSYTIKFRKYRKLIPELSQEQILLFCREKNINYAEHILEFIIEFENPSHQKTSYSIRELIDFTDDANSCVLMKGDWYKYNQDYLQALEASLLDLQVEFDPSWNWNEARYTRLIDSRYNATNFPAITEEAAKKLLREKYYYKEYAYNTIMVEDNQYELLDRNFERLDGGEPIELADLYKDNAVFAVKIGSSSSKLCYAIDQLSTSLKLLKKKSIRYDRTIHNAVVWIVLERQTELPTIDGKVNLAALKMIVFKNKLDTWQKEMRQHNFNPILRICYKH